MCGLFEKVLDAIYMLVFLFYIYLISLGGLILYFVSIINFSNWIWYVVACSTYCLHVVQNQNFFFMPPFPVGVNQLNYFLFFYIYLRCHPLPDCYSFSSSLLLNFKFAFFRCGLDACRGEHGSVQVGFDLDQPSNLGQRREFRSLQQFGRHDGLPNALTWVVWVIKSMVSSLPTYILSLFFVQDSATKKLKGDPMRFFRSGDEFKYHWSVLGINVYSC